MKTTGIIAAMGFELNTIKRDMEVTLTKIAVGTEFHIGTLYGKSVVLASCGVGKVNAAIVTQSLIDLFAVDNVINVGVAGGIHSDVKIGDLVISTETIQHDFCATALGFAVGIIPWADESIFKADNEMINIAKQSVEELGVSGDRNVFTARIASGDVFVSDNKMKKEIWVNTSAYCVEMEGAAIAQACALNKIPFVIIRSISDSADDESAADFDSFSAEAAELSGKLVKKMLEYN